MSEALPPRPRRSVLYMPGANARALEKAKSLPADGYIFDLEDSTAPDAKAAARDQVRAAVEAGGYGWRELVIRINALDTEWGAEDVIAAATAGPDAVLLPKVEGAAEVVRLAELLDAHGAPDKTRVWVMIETPRAILRLEEIAGAHRRLACFVMGTSDLVKDVGALHTPDRTPMLTALSLSVIAARAAGLAVLDGVHLDLDDEEGYKAQCRQGRALGFDGKTLIHPKQIEAANVAFAPSDEEVDECRRIIAAHKEAVAEGKGVVLLDGKLIENLHVEQAKRTLTLAEAIAASS